jgi:hypothetical protein
MAVPLSQMATVTKYVLTQKLKGVKRYPLVLMLEPLFRCNSIPGSCAVYTTHARAMLGCGGGMWRSDRQYSRW